MAKRILTPDEVKALGLPPAQPAAAEQWTPPPPMPVTSEVQEPVPSDAAPLSDMDIAARQDLKAGGKVVERTPDMLRIAPKGVTPSSNTVNAVNAAVQTPVQTPQDAHIEPPSAIKTKPDINPLESAALHGLDTATSLTGVPVGLPQTLSLQEGLRAAASSPEAKKDVPIDTSSLKGLGSSIAEKLMQLQRVQAEAGINLAKHPIDTLSKFGKGFSGAMPEARAGMQRAFEENPRASALGTIAPAAIGIGAPGGMIGKAIVGGALPAMANGVAGTEEFTQGKPNPLATLKAGATNAAIGAAGSINPMITGLAIGANAQEMPVGSPERKAADVYAAAGLLGGMARERGVGKSYEAQRMMPSIEDKVKVEQKPYIKDQERFQKQDQTRNIANQELDQRAREQIRSDFDNQATAQDSLKKGLESANQKVIDLKAKKSASMGSPMRQLLNSVAQYKGDVLADPNIDPGLRNIIQEVSAESPRLLQEATQNAKSLDEFKQKVSEHWDARIAKAEADRDASMAKLTSDQKAPELRLPPPKAPVPAEMIKALRERTDFQQQFPAKQAKANMSVAPAKPVPSLGEYLSGKAKPVEGPSGGRMSRAVEGWKEGAGISGGVRNALANFARDVPAREQNLSDLLGKYQPLQKGAEKAANSNPAVRGSNFAGLERLLQNDQPASEKKQKDLSGKIMKQQMGKVGGEDAAGQNMSDLILKKQTGKTGKGKK